MTEQTHIINRTHRPDSIELGTPGKGGVLKVYFDASNYDEAQELIENATKILAYAKTHVVQ
jgi:hypothetical protein